MTLHQIRKDLAFIVYLMDKQIKMSIEQYNIILEKSLYDVLKKKIGFPIDATGAETDMAHNDALRRYRIPAHLTLVGGSVALPDDYMRLLPNSAMNVNETLYTKVEYLNEEMWAYKLAHPTLPPTAEYPICKTQGNTLYVNPVTVSTIDFVYIKRPTTPVYSVSFTNGFYDDDSSTELDLDKEFHIDFIRQILEYLSIPTTNEMVLQYLQQKKIEEN